MHGGRCTGTDYLSTIAGYDPEALVVVFKETPAAHRFPGSMAADEGSYRPIADIVSPESLARVREHKQEMKRAAKG